MSLEAKTVDATHEIAPCMLRGSLNDTLFFDMDRQEVINYKDERYKLTEFNGVKVGSLTEATNNAGNWEK